MKKKKNSNITSNLIPHIDQTNRHQRNRSTTLTTILHQKSVVVRPLKLILFEKKKKNQTKKLKIKKKTAKGSSKKKINFFREKKNQ